MKYTLRRAIGIFFITLLPWLASAHLISITPTQAFPEVVTSSLAYTAIYTVTNTSSITLTGIADSSTLPAEMTRAPSSTCSATVALPAGQHCTIVISFNAPLEPRTFSGAMIKERALPSADGVSYTIPDIKMVAFSITPTYSFPAVVGTNYTSTAVYTLRNLSSMTLSGIYDHSILPSEITFAPESTCSPTTPLAPQASCTLVLLLAASDKNLTVTGPILKEAAPPSMEILTLALPNITISNQFMWTWVGGTKLGNQTGIYGTKGVADSNSMPGARAAASSVTDSNNAFWLFGGNMYDGVNLQYFNDLWKFDGRNWIWISGSDQFDQTGNYGTRGLPAPSNAPGAREYASSLIDNQNNFWLFGGRYFNSNGDTAYFFNDLWKFDGNNWTWVSGSNTTNQLGNYGTKGIADGNNIPGARYGAVAWTDKNAQLWLFSGGVVTTQAPVDTQPFNDLWKFDGRNWTWIGGANTPNQEGNYGAQGVAAATNWPGARQSASSTLDHQGNLWIFGGLGFGGEKNIQGHLNDLWKFNTTTQQWTWISGSTLTRQKGVYGEKGIPASTNVPGSRYSPAFWIDSNDHLWLFGGYGYDSAGDPGALNDLWTFNPGTNLWTWINGSNLRRQVANYGTLNLPSTTNQPGIKNAPAYWIDRNDNLWLLGGYGYTDVAQAAFSNDFWKYSPQP